MDVGLTVYAAIEKYKKTGIVKSGSRAEDSSGNGSIMRLAPVPLYFRKDMDKAIHYSAESSRTTHQSDFCIDSCRYLGALIYQIINNPKKSKKEILFSNELLSLEYRTKEAKEIASGESWLNLKYNDLPNEGFVIDTLISAVWCFYHSNGYSDSVLKAVNLCGDADTIGAVCGQMAGAYYGVNNIPKKWIGKLVKKEIIFEMVEKFYNLR